MKSTSSWRRKTLDVLDRGFRARLIVILDQFDLHLLVTDLQAAAFVDLVHPHVDVRPVCHGGAAGKRAGLGRAGADLDGVGGSRTGE